jgi:hypothetical protein
VRPEPDNISRQLPKIDRSHKPEIVAFYIEYNTVICYDTRVAIDGLQFIEISKIGLGKLMVPGHFGYDVHSNANVRISFQFANFFRGLSFALGGAQMARKKYFLLKINKLRFLFRAPKCRNPLW